MTNVLTPEPQAPPTPSQLATEKEARDVAEAAREQDWQAPPSSASCSRAISISA